jgi:ankyrin repeat protein
VDVDALDNDGSTPLHLAIYEANLEVVQLLLEHGASVHTQNNQGETLFQAASARGLQEITDVLSMHIERKQTT